MNISASPYHRGKGAERERMLTQRARDSLAYVVYCNLVGGQDELVFDGYSLVIDQDGELMARGAQFEEELVVCDIDPSTVEAARLRDARHRPAARMRRPVVAELGQLSAPAHHDSTEVGGPRAKPLELDAEVYAALCLGLRDYVEKNEFGGVLLGLSGGIDSALTACIAVDALGPESVRCAVMPSPTRPGDPARCAHPRRQPRHRAVRVPPRSADARLRRGPRRGVRRHGIRRGRGEHPGPHPRQPADGLVEQVRVARSHHRQQERVLRRLHHALWRHGRRVRPAEGRAQDARLPTGALPQHPWHARIPPGSSNDRLRPS